MGSSGKKATARVTLTDSGAVASVIVNASDPDMKASVEAAVRSAAPYPMPSDPDARREARTSHQHLLLNNILVIITCFKWILTM
jgi:colicin import membrane protein